MPVNKEAYLRYKIIDGCIRNKRHPFPSREKILDTLSEKLGREFSLSTLEKDFAAMREDALLGFYAPIKYSKREKGYYYDDPGYSIESISLGEEEFQALLFARRLLKQFSGNRFYEEFELAVQKIFDRLDVGDVMNEIDFNDIIEFESSIDLQTEKHLTSLITAIRYRNELGLLYKKFESNEAKAYLVQPYFLKEYKSRWYLLGTVNDQMRTFALDRIESSDLTDSRFLRKESINFDLYFKHIYGITSFGGNPQKVVLAFSYPQAAYIKSTAMHGTQRTVKDDAKQLIVEMHVGVTFELVMDILSYGAAVTVLKPHDLRQKVIDLNIETSKNYK